MPRRFTFALALLAGLPFTSPAAAQGDIQRAGPIVHRAANVVFPEQVGEFRRTAAMQYDQAGLDVSAGYSLIRPEGWLHLTIYVYPAPNPNGPDDRERLCNTEFQANLREIHASPVYSNFEGGPTGSAPAVAGIPAALSHRAAYTYDFDHGGRSERVTSEYELYCFVGGNWFVKYRATATQGFPVADAVRSFIPIGPWPGRGSPATTASAVPGTGLAPLLPSP